jgi:hypothetical protein
MAGKSQILTIALHGQHLNVGQVLMGASQAGNGDLVSGSCQSNAHLSLMSAAIAEYAIPQAMTDCHSTSAAERRCL